MVEGAGQTAVETNGLACGSLDDGIRRDLISYYKWIASLAVAVIAISGSASGLARLRTGKE